MNESMHIRQTTENREMDMTPMIDLVFLLITFFIFLLNFSEAEQDERVKLPKSELAIPTKVMPAEPLTLQIMVDGTILFNGKEYSTVDFPAALGLECRLYGYKKIPLDKITVLLRGDNRADTGQVLDLVEECQKQGFSDFRFVAISEKQ
jgi:biopolymer transport protein ExbD